MEGNIAGANSAFQLAIDSGHPEAAPIAVGNLAKLCERMPEQGFTQTSGNGPDVNDNPMTLSNRDRVGRGLEILASGLGSLVHARMTATSPDGQDWASALAARDSSRHGGPARRYQLSDPRFLLRVLTEQWVAFKDQLTRVERGFATELRDTGNKWAHGDSFSADDTYRALDTIERLLVALGATEQADKVRDIRGDTSPSRV